MSTFASPTNNSSFLIGNPDLPKTAALNLRTDLDSEESRQKLTKMVMRLFDHWELTTADQLELLGLSANSRRLLTQYRKKGVLPKELFKHSRALDNKPAFRNINYHPGPDAFDDLLDPGETPSDAAVLAFQKANRMRTTVSEVAALDQTSLFHIVIQRVFRRAIFYPSRYEDGYFPVWYGYLDPLTTIHETALSYD